MGKRNSDRDTSRDYAEELLLIPKDIKKRHIGINRCLKIVLYGDPFKDSRPRVTKYGTAVVLNMIKMKKVFHQLYQRFPFLQTLTILSPYVLHLKMFSQPTVSELKVIKKDPHIKKLYDMELLYDTAISDVDNSIKIHNDILLEPEFRITIDDAMNVEAFGQKYLSSEPRVEFFVYYSTKTSEFYKWRVMNNHNYFKWLISYKYMMIKNHSPKKHLNHLIKSIKERLPNIKNDKDATSFIKRIVKVLDAYPVDVLKSITETLEDSKFTKNNTIVKIVIKACQGNKLCLDKINTISWNSNEYDEDEKETISYESFDRIYKELHSSV